MYIYIRCIYEFVRQKIPLRNLTCCSFSSHSRSSFFAFATSFSSVSTTALLPTPPTSTVNPISSPLSVISFRNLMLTSPMLRFAMFRPGSDAVVGFVEITEACGFEVFEVFVVVVAFVVVVVGCTCCSGCLAGCCCCCCGTGRGSGCSCCVGGGWVVVGCGAGCGCTVCCFCGFLGLFSLSALLFFAACCSFSFLSLFFFFFLAFLLVSSWLPTDSTSVSLLVGSLSEDEEGGEGVAL